jgi:hypothetical protein
MKKEQLNMFVIGGVVIITFGFVAYVQNNRSDQAELMTQNESPHESDVTGTDGWEVDSTVATETARTGDGVTHTDAQEVPDLSKVENTNNGERSADTYRAFQNSHVPYSRSIADVFPVTGTPAYRLEYRFSGQFEDKYSEEVYADYQLGDHIDGCPSDRSVNIALTKFDPGSKKYIPIVDDFCLSFDFSVGFYPVWSRDERYVAFVDEKTFTFDIFNPETTQILSFIDTKNLQEGVQSMPLPGYRDNYAFSWPRLAFDFSTVRKTEDGHIQVIGIGTWDYQRDGYVFVFDFTDWSLKQILNIEPNDDVLMGAEWSGPRVVRAYTLPTDVVKKCEEAVLYPNGKSRGGKITGQSYTPAYYNCRKINASNFSQMKTHTIPF